MVYSKSNSRRSYRNSGREISKAKSGTASTLNAIANVASTALKIGMFAASILNAELKYTDTQASDVILAPGTNVIDQIDVVSAIPEGTDYNERNGRSILAKHLEFEGFCKLDFLTDPGTVLDGLTRQVRYMVLVDTQLPNTDQPSSGTANLQLQDILQYTADSDACITSPQNYDNQDRYHKLLDKRFQLTVGDETTHFFKEYIPLDFHCTYSGPTSADLNQNNIYFFFFTDNNFTIQTNVRLSYASRMSFYDN